MLSTSTLPRLGNGADRLERECDNFLSDNVEFSSSVNLASKRRSSADTTSRQQRRFIRELAQRNFRRNALSPHNPDSRQLHSCTHCGSTEPYNPSSIATPKIPLHKNYSAPNGLRSPLRRPSPPSQQKNSLSSDVNYVEMGKVKFDTDLNDLSNSKQMENDEDELDFLTISHEQPVAVAQSKQVDNNEPSGYVSMDSLHCAGAVDDHPPPTPPPTVEMLRYRMERSENLSLSPLSTDNNSCNGNDVYVNLNTVSEWTPPRALPRRATSPPTNTLSGSANKELLSPASRSEISSTNLRNGPDDLQLNIVRSPEKPDQYIYLSAARNGSSQEPRCTSGSSSENFSPKDSTTESSSSRKSPTDISCLENMGFLQLMPFNTSCEGSKPHTGSEANSSLSSPQEGNPSLSDSNVSDETKSARRRSSILAWLRRTSESFRLIKKRRSRTKLFSPPSEQQLSTPTHPSTAASPAVVQPSTPSTLTNDSHNPHVCNCCHHCGHNDCLAGDHRTLSAQIPRRRFTQPQLSACIDLSQNQQQTSTKMGRSGSWKTSSSSAVAHHSPTFEHNSYGGVLSEVPFVQQYGSSGTLPVLLPRKASSKSNSLRYALPTRKTMVFTSRK